MALAQDLRPEEAAIVGAEEVKWWYGWMMTSDSSVKQTLACLLLFVVVVSIVYLCLCVFFCWLVPHLSSEGC